VTSTASAATEISLRFQAQRRILTLRVASQALSGAGLAVLPAIAATASSR